MYNFQTEEQRKQKQLEFEKLQNKSAKENSEMRLRIKASKLSILMIIRRETRLDGAQLQRKSCKVFERGIIYNRLNLFR